MWDHLSDVQFVSFFFFFSSFLVHSFSFSFSCEETTCTPGSPSVCSANQNTQCVSGVPVLFGGSIALATYGSNQCSGNPIEQLSWTNNLCVQFGPDSFTAFCSYGNMYLFYFTQTNICLGQAYYWICESIVCSFFFILNCTPSFYCKLHFW